MNCDDYEYTDITVYEKDGDTERIKPVYWGDRYNKFCDDVAECEYKGKKG